MLSKSISICKKYNLYNNTGDWKAVAQGASRALTGKCEKEWDKLVDDLNNWNAGGANKHKVLVQKPSQKVFKKKGYETQKDAMREGLSYQGHDHREAIEQLYELNSSYLSFAKTQACSTKKTSVATSSPRRSGQWLASITSRRGGRTSKTKTRSSTSLKK